MCCKNIQHPFQQATLKNVILALIAAGAMETFISSGFITQRNQICRWGDDAVAQVELCGDY